ncbi:OmpA family protein [Pelagovum pacificum]|uniref:OmpA family protein n=1 Tax=Pelagovum pacificum TaxID=2588711 RepID=A0A5C5GAD0_9RHOB|nr:OmpA family protein [Pelagovum pacificum]QQA42537.1 OmpA family protein [Pelagovum pacificum]TNY31621.1 OmpA family protein [Pelagovum pacificum]
MRLKSIATVAVTFVLAALLSVIGARAAVSVVEDRSVIAVREALTDEGQAWVEVLGDGLQVILEGEAPSEAVRFRSITIAGTQVDASRVIDNMSVADPDRIEPPEFVIEMLRNDSGISLIGLVPANTDREDVAARIAAAAEDMPVTDLLETADHPVPEGWDRALEHALTALELLPRSKISVTPGHVDIIANADSPEAKARLETRLNQRLPQGVEVAIEISAPRPVITPFTTRFILDDSGARFDACAADTDRAQARIAAAATSAGFEGEINCPLGLGTPSRSWSDAVSRSILAVNDLGGGTVTVSDADVLLVAREGTEQGEFDRIVGELENSLPDVFALEAVLPVAPDVSEEGPPQFTATRSPEGLVQLRGRVEDDLMNTTAQNYARARFVGSEITMGTRIAEELPQGWSVRVLAGIQALSELSHGSVVVEPDSVDVRGVSGNQEASGDISRMLIEKLGQDADFEIDVTYEESLDPIAALPTPEECLQQIGVVSAGRKITFEPGSDDITGESQAVVDDIAEILRRCPDLRVEVAGYTDSQGREEMNQELSQRRAEAVLAALRVRRVPVASFDAVGYGEVDPIADNDTAEGREANRRIEFRLIEPGSDEEPTGLEQVEDEATDDGDAAEGEDDTAADDQDGDDE